MGFQRGPRRDLPDGLPEDLPGRDLPEACLLGGVPHGLPALTAVELDWNRESDSEPEPFESHALTDPNLAMDLDLDLVVGMSRFM